MNKEVIVKVNWVSVEEGGKKRIPMTEYSTAAHFHCDEDGRDWSVILKFISHNGTNETTCSLNFLFPESAPQNLLNVGSKFDLFESKKVADGEIIKV